MRSHFAILAFPMLVAGCGGGGGGSSTPPPPPSTFTLTATVWNPSADFTIATEAEVTFAGGTTPTVGDFAPGTVIQLTAHVPAGCALDAWAGTNDDASLSTSNATTMPASDHQVEATMTPVGSG